MVKRIITYLLIIAGIAVMWMSTSPDAMQRLSDARNDHDEWWGAHFPIEGDLVGMSYLYYEKQLFKDDRYVFARPVHHCDTGMNLYVWGDSYAGLIPDTAYGCISSFKYSRRYSEQMLYHLDTSKKNVLLIEVVERYVREYFASPDHIFDNVKDTGLGKAIVSYVMLQPKTTAGFSVSFDVNKLFNEHINQNLEYNLFNYNFISPVRKGKAWFNYHCFDRASGNVAVSDNGKYLLLNETLLPDRTESSYSKYTEEQLTAIINSLNAIDEHYRAAGFDEVYVSLIPNPVSVLQPKGYNELIPAIQNDHRLRIKVIDIYSRFVTAKEEVYLHGDTHWNERGANMWVQEVNEVLYKDLH